jgi:single-strand DNA-binding protein
MNLNKVFIIGRLAADPESRTTPHGQTVVTIRVATNRAWNDRTTGEKQERTEFHTVIVWGNLGEIASKYLRKGQLVFFEGHLQTRSWQGQDGVKRFRTEIVAENMQLGPKAMTSGAISSDQAQPEQVPQGQIPEEIKEEDIPIIDEDAPVSSGPIVSEDEIEEKEIDLKDIPF